MKVFSRLIVIALVVFLSCKRPGNGPVVQFPSDFKSYIVFPEGSYWVYRDTDSFRTDTVFLYSSTIEVVEYSRRVDFEYEMLNQLFSSTYHDDTLFGKALAYHLKMYGILEYSEKYQSYGVSNTQFLYGYNVGDSSEFVVNRFVEYTSFYDSLSVNSKQYKEVKIFTLLQESEPRLPKKVWYAKNVGVIKKELFNGQVWELQEHYINE